MRQAMVVGNWKMNGSLSSIDALVKSLKGELKGSNTVNIAVSPPFVFLDYVKNLLEGSCISLCAQDLSENILGAHTGEVSGGMLKQVGCRYVIVGHSERRSLKGETNQSVAAKFAVALEQGLRPILCVGESLQQREAGATLSVISDQLKVVIEKVGLKVFSEAIVAYEPVWAIGTGQTATPEQAQEVHHFIRSQFSGQADIAEKLIILYGGSVKSSNAAALFLQDDIDGGLVGGASLDAKEFISICDVAA